MDLALAEGMEVTLRLMSMLSKHINLKGLPWEISRDKNGLVRSCPFDMGIQYRTQ